MLDVAGFTLVQRGIRNEDRVTMFGVMEAFSASASSPAAWSLRRSSPRWTSGGRSSSRGRLLPLLAVVTSR